MDETITLESAAIATLMALSALFSGSETALISLRQMQQGQMRRAGLPEPR